jgi:hypothetical protein
VASLTDIRAALAASLGALEGVQVSPYELSNPTPPVIWVKPDPGEFVTYHQAMRNGLELWHFVVEAYAGAMFDIGAQMTLDPFVVSSGATSVKAAIEADKTLGGIAQDLVCDNAHGYAAYQRVDGTTFHGCRWNVLIYMQGG